MIQIEVDGFSGPLDLLCHMIETGEMDAAHISVAQVVRAYGSRSAGKKVVPIDVTASFLVQAARLVLDKVMALMPRQTPDDGGLNLPSSPERNDGVEDMEAVLERYRPYRKAASILADLQSKWSARCFRFSQPLPPHYDLGDLYTLSSLWWELMTKSGNRAGNPPDSGESCGIMAGVPSSIPDEVHVERKMEAIMGLLQREGALLSSILGGTCQVADLVVTVLALLELSRRSMVRLEQKEMFGDVLILPQP